MKKETAAKIAALQFLVTDAWMQEDQAFLIL
jgi:hypothetical protein